MKKTLFSTLIAGLLSMQAHADYIAQPQSVASQAARFSTMGIHDLQKAAQAGQAGAQFYLGTRYQYGKDVALSLIHISEPTRPSHISRMPSSA